MANTFQSFSRRLSRRIILIVLVTLVLMGGASQSDDLTMLAVRYMGNNK